VRVRVRVRAGCEYEVKERKRASDVVGFFARAADEIERRWESATLRSNMLGENFQEQQRGRTASLYTKIKKEWAHSKETPRALFI